MSWLQVDTANNLPLIVWFVKPVRPELVGRSSAAFSKTSVLGHGDNLRRKRCADGGKGRVEGALECVHIGAATLNLFETEPLAQNHPFQTHPEVNVTPHIASQTIAISAAAREHIDRAAGAK
jgi:hypothetical protein